LAAVAVKYPAFKELGTEVLTLSVDSIDSHKGWREKELSQMVRGGALFPMLSDSEGRIGALYGVYDSEKGVDQRGRFLIDPMGVIQSIEIVSDPVGRDIAEALRQLRALQHHQATGDYMPCGWEPGKPTLTKDQSRSGEIWKEWKTRHAF
jgi:peroxiredoxin (alkyl hydroperoxide reductase subunit C)